MSQPPAALMGRADGERLSTNPEFLRQGSPSPTTRTRRGSSSGGSPARRRSISSCSSASSPRSRPPAPRRRRCRRADQERENGFLALKLSFVNEVAALSEEYGVEVEQVLEGIALDPRIGSSYMQPEPRFRRLVPPEGAPGPGIGGSPPRPADAHRPRDRAGQRRAAGPIRPAHPRRAARRGRTGRPARAELQGRHGRLRGSPALYVARRLLEGGQRSRVRPGGTTGRADAPRRESTWPRARRTSSRTRTPS